MQGAYRLVFLNEEGRVVDFQELRFEDDAEAVAHVMARRHGQPVELWRDGRLVRRIDPQLPA